MKKLLLAIGCLFTLGVNAQDYSAYAPSNLGEGIVYYLPKTVIDIEVVATKIHYTPGDLCLYAGRYLRMNNVSDTPETHWEIKAVNVTSKGIPDTENAYQVKVKDKDLSSNVQLTREGLIEAINTTAPETVKQPITENKSADMKLDPNKYLTEDILNATSTAKEADLVAKEIYNIRDSKKTLVSGQADNMPKDGTSLKLMLENLEEQEQALTQLFAGVTTKEEQIFHFLIAPEDKMVDKIAFRFSNKLGVLDANNLAGTPVYISINSTEPIPELDPKTAEKKKKINGIIYNIPGKANVKINTTEKTWFNGELLVTQFGSTEVLVNDLFKSKVNTKVIFNPETGSIIKIDKDI
ncbi:MAG: DUF4831 family protein [Phocaeicola sp.]|uniref:DUF4831 family protein n=1 Tax=Phocaeicola TaxID=909656 RepID=UPI00234FA85E|nr:DUF4831 family protein [Phocaeicola oris]MCE2615934.1 DUF4831 family protein [Phocaeicola oris]